MCAAQQFTTVDRAAFDALVDGLVALPALYSDAGRADLVRMVQGDPDPEEPNLFYVPALDGNWGSVTFRRGVLYDLSVPTTSQVIGEPSADLRAAHREQAGWLEQRLGQPVRAEGSQRTRLVFQLPTGGELALGIGGGVNLELASPALVSLNDVVVSTDGFPDRG